MGQSKKNVFVITAHYSVLKTIALCYFTPVYLCDWFITTVPRGSNIWDGWVGGGGSQRQNACPWCNRDDLPSPHEYGRRSLKFTYHSWHSQSWWYHRLWWRYPWWRQPALCKNKAEGVAGTRCHHRRRSRMPHLNGLWSHWEPPWLATGSLTTKVHITSATLSRHLTYCWPFPCVETLAQQ